MTYHLYRVLVHYDFNRKKYYAGRRDVIAESSETARELALESVKDYREGEENNYFGELYASSIVVLVRNILIEGNKDSLGETE